MTEPVFIYAYDPNWALFFENEKCLIAKALGASIESIDHIGSTSIDGLSAKPIIDILIGVKSLPEVEKECIQGLESIGYQYIKKHELKMPERRFFVKNKDGKRFVHIHLIEKNSPFWRRHIAFRDYLRRHPEVAKEYDVLKRDLARRHKTREDYTAAKSVFIQAIEKKALFEE